MVTYVSTLFLIYIFIFSQIFLSTRTRNYNSLNHVAITSAPNDCFEKCPKEVRHNILNLNEKCIFISQKELQTFTMKRGKEPNRSTNFSTGLYCENLNKHGLFIDGGDLHKKCSL